MYAPSPKFRAACEAAFLADGGDPSELHGQKRFATLAARAALAGHQLVMLPTGGYMLIKGPHSLHLTGLDAVEMALDRMGGRKS